MQLTRDQALLVSSTLVLAMQAQLDLHPHHGRWGKVRHVRTEAGEREYHEPLGALIVAHPHEHLAEPLRERLEVLPKDLQYGDHLGNGKHVQDIRAASGGYEVTYQEGGRGLLNGRRRIVVDRLTAAPSHLAVAPPRPAAPEAEPTVSIPGAPPVTASQIESAIGILNAGKNTWVGRALANQRHPLATMDYHRINKEVLARHPEVRLESGTKQKHVGQVKASVLHYLAEQLASLNRPVPPVEEGPRREHITPDRVRLGDTIATLDGPKVVHEVTSASPREVSLRLASPGSSIVNLSPTYVSRDGGPVVIRLERGPESRDQPWDALMAPEHPEPTTWRDIHVGDRLHLGASSLGGPKTGVVEGAETVRGEDGTPGVSLDFREDDSTHYNITLFGGSETPEITRLIRGDGNAGQRIEQARLARAQAGAATGIHDQVRRYMQQIVRQDARSLEQTASHPMLELGLRSLGSTPVAEKIRRQRVAQAVADELVTAGGRAGEEQRAEVAKRITPALEELGQALRDSLVKAYSEAMPLPEDYHSATPGQEVPESSALFRARMRVLAPYLQKDFDIPFSMTAAKALASLVPLLQGDSAPYAPVPAVPVFPLGGDLTARIAAYRAVLPTDHANIGKQIILRQVFEAPTHASLERGEVPRPEVVELGVPDRAADDGPGAMTMRHLDVVMAAGRDLDAEFGFRVEQRLGERDIIGETVAVVEALKAAEARVTRSYDEADAARKEAQDRYIQEQEAGASQLEVRQRAQELRDRQWGVRFKDPETGEIRRPTEAEQAQAREDLSKLQKILADSGHAGSLAYEAKMKEYAGARDERIRLRDERDRLQRAGADTNREVALELLREVREDGLGGAKLSYRDTRGNKLTERHQLVQAMRWAEQHYPTSWLEQSRDRRKSGLVLARAKRGWHSISGTIKLSTHSRQVSDSPVDGKHDHVSVHELGHEMEDMVPGIVPLEDAYLWSRTSTGEIGDRTRERRRTIPGYRSNEAGYPDTLPEGYSGKTYGSVATPRAFELLTTGAESLFAGSRYLDPSFRQFMLGTLALV